MNYKKTLKYLQIYDFIARDFYIKFKILVSRVHLNNRKHNDTEEYYRGPEGVLQLIDTGCTRCMHQEKQQQVRSSEFRKFVFIFP